MLEARALSYAMRPAGAEARGFAAFDFTVARGETVAFVGAAAPALHGVLAGLHRGYRGALIFQGREYAEWGRDFYDRVGIGFARPRLHAHLTVGETLSAYAALYSTPGEPGALAKLGLEGREGMRVGGLSAGERKRLDLALAFRHGPEAVFLEEPLVSLDLEEAGRVMQWLRGEKRPERTLIVCTADETAGRDFFDRVVKLP